jgi:hypothetical protein
VRQVVERDGKGLTDAQTAALKAKAEALFAAGAAAELARLDAGVAEELRLLELTTEQREIELRVLERKNLLMAANAQLAAEEAEAIARGVVGGEQVARKRAGEIGELKEDLKRAYIESGTLGFDQVGDYAKRKLREKIYEALLDKPFEILVNAVVRGSGNLFGGGGSGSLAGGAGGGLGGLGSIAGLGGLARQIGSIFGIGNSGAQLAAINAGVDDLLATGGQMNSINAGVDGLLASGKTSWMGQAGNFAGGAFQGYSYGTMAADALGLKGSGESWQVALDGVAAAAGQAIGGPIGSAVATFGSRLVGGLFQGEGERPQAQAEVVLRDGAFAVAGSRQGDQGPLTEIVSLAEAVAQSLNAAAKAFELDLSKLPDLYAGVGYVKGKDSEALGQGFYGGLSGQSGTLSGLRESAWDAGFHNGFSNTGVTDAKALAESIVKETILRAIDAGAGALTASERRVIEQATDLDKAAARIQLGRSLMETVSDAILQLTDPAAFEREQALEAIEASYGAMKAQAAELIAAGLVGAEVLGEIDRLNALQVADALKRLGEAAETAVDALEQQKPAIADWLDKLRGSDAAELNPAEQRAEALQQYERELIKARAGDGTAIAGLTGYADALLGSDREATASAAERRALYDKVTGEVAALAGIAPVPAVTEERIAWVGEVYDRASAAGARGTEALIAAIEPGVAAARAAVEALDLDRDAVISRLEFQAGVASAGFDAIVNALDGWEQAWTRSAELRDPVADLTTAINDSLLGQKLDQLNATIETQLGPLADNLGDLAVATGEGLAVLPPLLRDLTDVTQEGVSEARLLGTWTRGRDGGVRPSRV